MITAQDITAARILGIDPGTLMVGYGVVDLGPTCAFRYVECGLIRAPQRAPMAQRLHVIVEAIEEIIEEFRPSVIALERAFHGRNAASALKLGSARGAIMAAGARHGLAVHEYAPASVKRVVAGHGRAGKADIQRRVSLLCRLAKTPPTDAADALAIALCHAQTVGVG